MEKRATKKRYLIFLLCICMIVPQVLLQKPQKAVAASDAIVIVNVLNVRTGPGTTYDRVVVDGIEAYLVGQQEIEVTGTSGEWYQINASFRGKDISGYVYGPYVSLMTEIAPADKPKPGPKDPAEKPGSADKPKPDPKDPADKPAGPKEDPKKPTSTPTPKPTATPTPKPTSTPTPSPKPTATPVPASTYAGSDFELPGFVDATVLNLRSDATTNSEKLGQATAGTKVTVLNEKRNNGENWYRVAITLGGEEKIGYMLSTYITLYTDKEFYVKTVKGNTTLRTSATSTAPSVLNNDGEVISLKADHNLWVYKELNDTNLDKWFQVRVSKSGVKYYGYINAKDVYLYGYQSKKTTNSGSVTATPTPTPKPVATTTPTPSPIPQVDSAEDFQITAYVNTNGLNFRKEASASSEKIGVLGLNTKVTILNEVDVNDATWYRIATNIDGKQEIGYVHGYYLRFDLAIPINAVIAADKTRVRSEANSASAYVKAANGYILSLNSGDFATLLAQETSESKQWFEISVMMQNSTYKGYVTANAINLATPTPSPAPTNPPIVADEDFQVKAYVLSHRCENGTVRLLL